MNDNNCDVLKMTKIACYGDCMKKVMMVGLMLIAQTALAYRSQAQSSDERKLNDQAGKIARILLNRQISHCVSEFQKEDVAISDVTEQELPSGSTRYQIKGEILQGGDIAVGQIVMTIEETSPVPFAGKSYSCSISK
jgi:hypothetical protein